MCHSADAQDGTGAPCHSIPQSRMPMPNARPGLAPPHPRTPLPTHKHHAEHTCVPRSGHPLFARVHVHHGQVDHLCGGMEHYFETCNDVIASMLHWYPNVIYWSWSGGCDLHMQDGVVQREQRMLTAASHDRCMPQGCSSQQHAKTNSSNTLMLVGCTDLWISGNPASPMLACCEKLIRIYQKCIRNVRFQTLEGNPGCCSRPCARFNMLAS